MRIPFTKMHGLGNDFVLLDRVSHDYELTQDRIRELADRHRGIGFDQLLQIEPPSNPQVDFDYRIFNPDGSEVEHCGNGARCFARFVTDKGLTARNPIAVKTMNRVLSLRINGDQSVTVNMDRPRFEPDCIPFKADAESLEYARQFRICGELQSWRFSALSMGNPHVVIRVEDLEQTAVKDIGEAVGSHEDFPEGTNVGFMQILGPNEVKLRVFERGVGETLACGTGACAAVVVGRRLDLLHEDVTVNLPGGQLRIQWQLDESPVLMSGPVTTVYEGMIDI